MKMFLPLFSIGKRKSNSTVHVLALAAYVLIESCTCFNEEIHWSPTAGEDRLPQSMLPMMGSSKPHTHTHRFSTRSFSKTFGNLGRVTAALKRYPTVGGRQCRVIAGSSCDRLLGGMWYHVILHER